MQADKQEIQRTLQLLFTDSDTVELRAFENGRAYNGYYRSLAKLSQDACQLNNQLQAQVYIVGNPVQPELYQRRPDDASRCGKGEGTADHQAICRRWLIVDCDPVKADTASSASDLERQAAEQLAQEVYRYLVDLGLPAPAVASSGNGYWLLYRLADLPNDRNSRWVLRQFLLHLAERFDNQAAIVDRSTYSAAQLIKLLGTVAKKGPDTAERPHRLSQLLSVPDQFQPVTWQQLVGITGQPPADSQAQQPQPAATSGSGWDIPQLLADHQCQYTVDDEYTTESGEPASRYELAVCPFDPQHDDRSAYLIQWQNGAVCFGCHHNGCSGKGWQELKQAWQLPSGDQLYSQVLASLPQQPLPAIELQPLRLRPVSTATVQPKRWLWDKRLPLGNVAVIAGNGEVGKTTLCCDLAAKISTGRSLPGSAADAELFAGSVIFISDEEDEQDIAARIAAAGGDPEKVLVLADDEIFDTYQADVPRLAQAIEQLPDVRLLVFDTLPDFLGQYNDHHNSGVRQAVRSLVRLARQTGVAVLGLCHFNKSLQGAVGHRLLGSVAYRNLPRSVLYVLQDPDNEQRRIVYHEKNNHAPKQPPLGLLLQGNDSGSVQITWEQGVCVIDDLNRYLGSETPAAGRRNAAADWLLSAWGLGAGPKAPAQVIAEAEQQGITRRTLYRAANDLGLQMTGKHWALPGAPLPDAAE